MNGYIDLHVHTIASDGSMTPTEVVRLAAQKGLFAIAITDHDTIAGIAEALEEAEKVGVKVIPGIEIAADFRGEMHLLGYFTKENYKKIQPVLDSLRKARDERNPKMVQKLNDVGVDITMEEIQKVAGGNIVARPHFAKVMVQKGFVKNVNDAFEHFIGDMAPCYVKKSKLTPHEAIQAINNAGGIAVLAHPIHLGLGLKELDKVVGDLAMAGLKGIEAIYVDNTEQDTGNFLRIAIAHNLVATGGSDFHGEFKPGIGLGVGRGNLKIPCEILDQLGL